MAQSDDPEFLHGTFSSPAARQALDKAKERIFRDMYEGMRMDKIEPPKRDAEKLGPGCGDPNCPLCYPETARRGGRGVSSYIADDPFGPPRRNEWRSPGVFNYQRDFQQIPREDDTDREYNEARKAVEDWVSEAPKQAFDDIVGNAEALEQLRDAIEAPKKHAKLYKAYGMQMPKGALLSGPPGCGKTMFARAAASEMKRLYKKGGEFICISGSSLQSKFVGETEQRITAIFKFARAYKKKHKIPLLVFMDEAEVLLPDRTGRIRRVAPWEESQVATFLAEMDGMHESGAFVLLATNRPDVIDQAVLRDGRCDFKITVKRPNAEAVETIMRGNFDGVPVHEEATIDDLVFAAVESFNDPHRVIMQQHAIRVGDGYHVQRDFTMEHIVSGAMAASVPTRAKRRAFSRDKDSGEVTGVTVADVVGAVNDLYEENKGLTHEFALREFMQEFVVACEEAPPLKDDGDKRRKLN